MDTCLCGRKMVSPVGPKDATILVVGESPDFKDLQVNMPFVSERGDVLRAELSSVGIDLRHCRLTFVWRHAPEKDCKGHMGDVLREMKNCPYVLLIGAGTMKAFAIDGLDTRIGLPMSSVFFPAEVKIVVGVTNPPTHSAIGEFRLALQKFKRRIDEFEETGGQND